MFGKRERELTKLEQAEAALARHDKLLQVSKGEVLGPLASAIESHQQAVQDLQRAEAEAAIGDTPAADPAKARKRLEAVRNTIDSIGLRLGGLRNAVANQAEELIAHHAAVTAERTAGYEAAKQELAAEWETAAQAYSHVLGMRKQLENLTGERLPLVEPEAERVELDAELGRPQRRLDELSVALSRIAELRRVASEGTLATPIPAYAVYQLTTSYEMGDMTLPAGSLVVECSLPEGQLRHWSQPDLRFAIPVANEALERSGSMAHEATPRIHREELDRAAAADRERQRNAPAFDFKLATMYPDLSEEERRKKMERLTPAEEKAMQEANARMLAKRAAQDHEALIEGERKSRENSV